MKAKTILTKILLLVLIASLLIAFTMLDLGEVFSLENLKAEQHRLELLYLANTALFVMLFVLVYVVSVAISLPTATALTLAAGALFGVWVGTAVVSVASTAGATLAFLSSRFVLRDMVQKRFGERLRAFNKGIEKEGIFYLFALRLVPIFPFFLINLGMGLTPIRARTFFWVSLVGMLPGTMAYVNAGTQLGQIKSLSGILSVQVLISFSILGLMPLFSKFFLNQLRANRLFRPFEKPKRFNYNVLVIGAGSGGLVSSYLAAALGAKVALIEKHKMGGDCLNTGCVPSKAFIRSAKMVAYSKRAKDFGLRSSPSEVDFSEIMERVQRVIRKIEPHDSVERYTQLGVDCIQGTAKLLTPYSAKVDDKIYTARSIVIATGAVPLVPNIQGLDQIPYLTTDTVWNLRELPKRLLILGGGPVGCELAQAFARIGSSVTLVEMEDKILVREDDEVSAFVTATLQGDGVTVLSAHKAKAFSAGSVICETKNGDVSVEFDEILLALGRKANVRGFGLEELGIALASNGTVAADDFMRTNYPNIFVCGDVTGPYQFTHMAAHQAWFASVNALFSPFKKWKVDYRATSWATFTDPEVARVGLNENEAKEKNIDYQLTRYDFSELDRAIVEEEDIGFMKVLTKPKSDKVLGVTIVGAHAGDIIAPFVLAMKNGLGLNAILRTTHIYPTFAEANRYVAGNWKKTNAPEWAMRLLKKFNTWRRR